MQNIVDFELAVRGFAGTYQAEITIDRGADSVTHAGPFALSFDPARLLSELGVNTEQYGRDLTAMLFAPDGMREALAEARGMAAARQTSLRLRLLLGAGAEDLQALRWELLYLPGRFERLCIREDILFSRYLPVGSGALPPAPKTALRALAAIAGPSNAESLGLAPVDLAKEKARAQAGLAGMEIDWLPGPDGKPCTLDRLITRIPGHEVLYLACHGRILRGQTWLVLEEEDGQSARIPAQDLVQRLAGTLALPRLAVLVVCESAGSDVYGAASASGALSNTGAANNAFLGSLAPRLVEIGIPAVVAMQTSLSFPTSDLFLPPLFRELQKDGMIDRAVSVARRSIMGRPDEHAPVLFMGLKSGLLWSANAAFAVPAAAAAPDPAAVQPPPVRSAAPAPSAAAKAVDPVRLYQILSSDAFTMEDLEGLCFTLHVDWEQMRGAVKTAKARAMIQFFQSRGRMAEFIEAIRAERPNLEL